MDLRTAALFPHFVPQLDSELRLDLGVLLPLIRSLTALSLNPAEREPSFLRPSGNQWINLLLKWRLTGNRLLQKLGFVKPMAFPSRLFQLRATTFSKTPITLPLKT